MGGRHEGGATEAPERTLTKWENQEGFTKEVRLRFSLGGGYFAEEQEGSFMSSVCAESELQTGHKSVAWEMECFQHD